MVVASLDTLIAIIMIMKDIPTPEAIVAFIAIAIATIGVLLAYN
jgi:hypothetical protein